ncbi:hypothetical protein ACRRTK_024475 [Alexandromys fortis]
MRVGCLIGPQVYTTTTGTVYIIFGFGNIQAVALWDIFVQAQNRDSAPPSLQIEEPEWEKHRSVSLSELLDVYSDGVELLQLVKAPDSNCSSLSIATRQGLVLLREQDLMPLWKLSLHGLHSQPTPGSFTDDQTLDFLLQTAWSWDEKDDGGGWSSGSIIWSHSIPCHMEETPTTSAVTSDQKSVFLFWAEALAAASLSSDDAPGAKPPGLYHLTSCTQPSRLSCT